MNLEEKLKNIYLFALSPYGIDREKYYDKGKIAKKRFKIDIKSLKDKTSVFDKPEYVELIEIKDNQITTLLKQNLIEVSSEHGSFDGKFEIKSEQLQISKKGIDFLNENAELIKNFDQNELVPKFELIEKTLY